jgi:hypothetical protein
VLFGFDHLRVAFQEPERRQPDLDARPLSPPLAHLFERVSRRCGKRLAGQGEPPSVLAPQFNGLDACLVYRLATHGRDYVDRRTGYFEKKRAQRKIVGLKRQAAELGMKPIPAA